MSERAGPSIPTSSTLEGKGAPGLSGRKKIAFAVASTVLLLGALEGVFRIAGWGNPDAASPLFSDWHDTPDGRLFWVVRGPGYNRDGMRDREHDIDKPPGVTRIVCLGDSVTEGWGVPRSHSYPFLLELFFEQMGLEAEVFTVAAAGWSTLQEVAAYEQIARKYRPDHVFLGFCLNDVAEMNNNLAAPPGMLWRLLGRSALFRAVVDAEARQVRNVEALFADPLPESVQTGWLRVEAEIEALAARVRSDGASLSVLVFPFRFQLTGNDGGNDGRWDRAQGRITSFCRARGLPCLDLLPALRRAGKVAFIDESHLSRTGAQVVAEEIIRWGRTGCAMCGHDLVDVDGERCPRCDSPIDR